MLWFDLMEQTSTSIRLFINVVWHFVVFIVCDLEKLISEWKLAFHSDYRDYILFTLTNEFLWNLL